MEVRKRPFPFIVMLVAALGLAACSGDTVTPINTRPVTPTGLTGTATTGNTIHLSWTAGTNATGYVVQRAATGGAFARVGTSATTGFDDSGLQPGTAYRYQVASTAGTDTSAYTAEVSVTTKAIGSATATLTGNITANRTLFSDTLYVLNGYVKVKSGATLTILPGTRIVGDTTVAGSSLWITRGGKIMAVGTAANPIVLTSQRPAGRRAPGDWGGLIIVGNGLVNRSVTGGLGTIFTEGPQGTGQNTGENYAGGTDNNDSSGQLKYVRIEFAGYAVLPDQELNSISSYAVGRGTTYDYVQSMAGLDDSFEFFGGAVDIRHMVSYEAGDDHFDWTEGFQGRGQFLIALQTTVVTPRAGAGFVSADPRGFEGDGCEIDKAGCTGFSIAPNSQPVWANFTIIGPGPGVFTPLDGNGAVIRRGAGVTLLNGIIARWPGRALNIRDTQANAAITNDSITISNLLLTDNGANFDPETEATTFGKLSRFPNANFKQPGVAASTLFTAVPAAGTAPVQGALDFTPAAGSAAATGGLTTFTARMTGRTTNFFGAAMPATAYIGAADPAGTDKWWQGWTVYFRN